MNRYLFATDPEVGEILKGELRRQQETLVMIASENYASEAVLAAQGSVFTNKYAEGLPGKRYYNGCEFMDQIESLTISRAKQLFGAEHVNAQPHSGSQANMAVYQALLQPGDTILSMKLDHGGHLSHGLKEHYSGLIYRIVHYGVRRDTELIDLERAWELARMYRPQLIIVGASAYPRHFDFPAWREIADEVGAVLMADMAHVIGLIIGKVHPDPVPYCDVVTFTTHKTMRGPRGAMILCRQKYARAIDHAIFPGQQGGPFMQAIAAKAVALREAMQPEFRRCQARIVQNAQTLAQVLQERGLRLVTGGTDNHLVLVDVGVRRLTGREAANALEEAGIIVNKNPIPFDTRPTNITSGIRIGTPAITTRGMGPAEVEQIGEWIAEVLENLDRPSLRLRIREEVRDLCRQFPIYADYLEQ